MCVLFQLKLFFLFCKLKWNDPDEEGLVEFLVKEKNFNEERVRQSIEKLKKSRNTSVQGRLTSFFGEPVKRKVKCNTHIIFSNTCVCFFKA